MIFYELGARISSHLSLPNSLTFFFFSDTFPFQTILRIEKSISLLSLLVGTFTCKLRKRRRGAEG